MDYFDFVKIDPVNYYILYGIEDLKRIKKNISIDSLKKLEEDLSQYNVLYSNEKRSVIYKKHHIEGFDKKDYVSLATYYWKDESKENGLPYIQKDGLANPEGDEYDKNNLRRLAFITYYHAILYYLSDDKKYLDLIIKNMIYYFLDEKTGMNPNMNHAQLVKGLNLGRGVGMIDFTANMSYALYMLKILYDEKLIEDNFFDSLKGWLSKFYNWYKYSDIALEEKYAPNNHGIFYDFGLIVILDILGKKDEIKALTYQMIELRIKSQIQKNKMILELRRTKSKNYSLMAIKGIYDFSKISSKYKLNLYNINRWYYKKVDIKIDAVEEYLYEFLVRKKGKWKYEQIVEFDEATLIPLIFECSSFDKKKLNDIKKLDNVLVDLHVQLISHLMD